MARLQPGENSKIDLINSLVADARSNDRHRSEEGLATLLELFQPLLLKICKKWSVYFNDDKHIIKSFDELLADAQYWFIHYTCSVYTVDGAATYNKFIKDHINQRIRYIYECELKYHKRVMFPDPNRNAESDDSDDMFDIVITKYCSDIQQITMEDNIVDEYESDCRVKLANMILLLLNDRQYFSERDKEIFTQIVCNGTTHDEMGKRLNISRTRITQILNRIKGRLYKMIDNSDEIWKMIGETDIEIKNDKW